MIALAWVLGSLTIYCALGYAVVAHWAPVMYERQRADTKGHYLYGSDDPEVQDSRVARLVRGEATATFALWPFRLPYLLMSQTAERRDPQRLEREIAERDRKIAELEARYLPKPHTAPSTSPSLESLRPYGWRYDDRP